MYKLTIWALLRVGDKGIHQLSSRIPENVKNKTVLFDIILYEETRKARGKRRQCY